MYVYEPGSGFSGEAKLIEPGFEWSDLCSSHETSVVESQFLDQSSEVKIEQKLDESKVMEVTPSNRYGL